MLTAQTFFLWETIFFSSIQYLYLSRMTCFWLNGTHTLTDTVNFDDFKKGFQLHLTTETPVSLEGDVNLVPENKDFLERNLGPRKLWFLSGLDTGKLA